MTVHITFIVTRRPKVDAQHKQTVAEYAARIRALEAELEQALNIPHVVDLAAERARRRPNAGGTSA